MNTDEATLGKQDILLLLLFFLDLLEKVLAPGFSPLLGRVQSLNFNVGEG